jgi:hypothetical protein
MAKIKRDISYFNRDFNSFRQQLIEFSKIYFPNTYNDFTPSSPGMMFIEQSSYVGDVLGFYLDNQIQENFIQYARQTNSIYELAYMFGYKPKISSAAQVSIDFYQQIPSKTVSGNVIPDFDYALTVGENTTISSNVGGGNFIIQDKIDFSISSSQDPTEISVYQASGGSPEYYLLKKSRKAISSEIKTISFNFGSPEKFQTVNFTEDNFLKILDIRDSNGEKWYEVDYLGQEMVYDKVKNTNIYDPNNVGTEGEVPYLLKLKKVQKRFATRILENNVIQLQFGAGTTQDNDEEIIPNPNNVGLGLPFKQDKLTSAYSPTNFLYTDTYGISPSNTTLTVRYLSGGGISSNVEANSLTNINTSNTTFNLTNLNPTTSNYVFSTLISNNEEAASGGGGGDTIEDIRQKVLSTISSQQRSVTQDDYLVRALSLPSDYGSISKALIIKPLLTDNQSSTIETLNLFCLSKDSNGHLTTPSQTLKKNLRTYLSQYRTIGDNIEIRDAFIINIGVNFEIIVLPDYNNNEIILECINQLREYFSIDRWQLNQPIMLKDLFILLDKVEGVQTVKDIQIINKAGTMMGYSQYEYDLKGATQNQIIYPSLDPSIFEIKYPLQDIKGQVVAL